MAPIALGWWPESTRGQRVLRRRYSVGDGRLFYGLDGLFLFCVGSLQLKLPLLYLPAKDLHFVH